MNRVDRADIAVERELITDSEGSVVSHPMVRVTLLFASLAPNEATSLTVRMFATDAKSIAASLERAGENALMMLDSVPDDCPRCFTEPCSCHEREDADGIPF